MKSTTGRRGLGRMLVHGVRAAVLLAAAGACCLAAQEQVKLEVRATSPRTELLTCEPLVLHVEVKNVGKKQVVMHEMSSTYGLSVNVRTPEGTVLPYAPDVEHWVHRVRTINLAPGEYCTHREVILCFSSFSYVLSEAGYYSIEVSYSSDGSIQGMIESAPLHLVVREPRGLDAEAFELFEGRRQAQFMAGRTDQRPPGEFQRLASDYPQTVYGRYARYYLAKALVAPKPQYAKSPYVKAARLLEGLVSEEQGFPLTDQCMLDLAECYVQTDRKDEARALLAKLLERFPESPVAVPAKKKLDSLQPPTPTPQVPQQADAKPDPAAVPQPQPAQPPAPAQ